MAEISDAELISAYLSGDEKSLEILIEKYLKAVYRFVYPIVKNSSDAEDLTQEIFVRVWKKITKFDRDKKFSSWLFAIAKNAAIDFIRRNKKTRNFSGLAVGESFSIEETLADTQPTPAETVQMIELHKTLAPAIKKLPAIDQQIIELRDEQALTFREISKTLQTPLNTVKSRYRRALTFLRKIIT